jgi:hypothetical protein
MLPRDRGRSKVRAGGKVPHRISNELSFKSKRLALYKGIQRWRLRLTAPGLDATLLFTSPLPRNHLARRHSRKRLLP